MNRRQLLQTLAATIPGGVVAHVEPDIKPEDLIVIECADILSDEQAARIRSAVQHLSGHGRVLVLGEGVKLRVERGIAHIDRLV